MNNEFPTPPEEVTRLAAEIQQMRGDFQSALSKLGQMEKRLRKAFPNLPKPPPKRSATGITAASSKTEAELLALFDELVCMKRDGLDSNFEAKIRGLAPEDTIALAIELGVGKGKNTSLKFAQEGIRGRINERILLNQNRQVTEKPPPQT